MGYCYDCKDPHGKPLDHNDFSEQTGILTHFYADPKDRAASLCSHDCPGGPAIEKNGDIETVAYPTEFSDTDPDN